MALGNPFDVSKSQSLVINASTKRATCHAAHDGWCVPKHLETKLPEVWSATTLRTSGRLCRAQQCWDPHVAQPDASERGLSPVNPPHGPPLSTSGLSSAFPVHEAWVPVAAAPSFPEEGADPRCWSPPLYQGTPNACGNWEGRCGENFHVAETDQPFPLDNREGLTETEMKQEGQPHRRSSLPDGQINI